MAAASTTAYRKSKTIRRSSKIDEFVLTPKIPVGERGEDVAILLDETLRKLLNGVSSDTLSLDIIFVNDLIFICF